MLGEIRDPETARVAMTAAGTGRVLMTTLHSKEAAMLTALRNWGIDNYQIIRAARLSRNGWCRFCEHCKEEVDGPKRPSATGWKVSTNPFRSVGTRLRNTAMVWGTPVARGSGDLASGSG